MTAPLFVVAWTIRRPCQIHLTIFATPNQPPSPAEMRADTQILSAVPPYEGTMSLTKNAAATLTFLALSVGLAACAGPDASIVDARADVVGSEVEASPRDAERDSALHAGGGGVKVEIDVPRGLFRQGKDVIVNVWNEKQMGLLERNAGCVASMDASGTEKIICPPGVTYEKPTPETFTLAYDALASKVVLDLKSVGVGERYDIGIGGTAADGCNHTAAGVRGVATPTIELKDVSFHSTLLACLAP